MTRLHPLRRFTGALAATSLAEGLGLAFTTIGSCSADADAKTAKTAEMTAPLHTLPTTAPKTRALNERFGNLTGFTMCSS